MNVLIRKVYAAPNPENGSEVKKRLSFLRVPGRNPQNLSALQLWAPDRSTQGRQSYFVCASIVGPWQEHSGATIVIYLRFNCGPLTGALRATITFICASIVGPWQEHSGATIIIYLRFNCGPLTGALRATITFICASIVGPDRNTQRRQVLFFCASIVGPWLERSGATIIFCLHFNCGPLNGTLRGDKH